MTAPSPRTRTLLIVTVAIVGATGFGLVLSVVPMPQSFTLREASISDPNTFCGPGIDTTKGTTVAFRWSAPSPVSFSVLACGPNEIVYSGYGDGGAGSFVAVGGFYQFGSLCPEGPCVAANVTGTFVGPILHWFPPGI